MSVSILVVDDEPDVADLFRREVRDGTYVMHFANSGEDALQKLGNGIEPQLIVILSDINMPGMDGLHLLGEIKRRFPALPVMMVTAYDDDGRKQRASDLGACEFLAKRVDFERLRAHLRASSVRCLAFQPAYARLVSAIGDRHQLRIYCSLPDPIEPVV